MKILTYRHRKPGPFSCCQLNQNRNYEYAGKTTSVIFQLMQHLYYIAIACKIRTENIAEQDIMSIFATWEKNKPKS